MKLNVASPCPMSWDAMSGDDRMRFCARCKLHVYNLSAMKEGELEQLLREREGKRLCGRFFQRPDGTVMTRDCPVGWRRKMLKAVGIAAAFLIGAVLTAAAFGADTRSSGQPAWIQSVLEWLGVVQPKVQMVGEICPPPTPPVPPTP